MKCRLTPLRSQRKARCKARCLSLAAASPVEIVLDLPWSLGPSLTFPIFPDFWKLLAYPATANPWICNTNFTAWRQGNAKLTVWRSQALVPQPHVPIPGTVSGSRTKLSGAWPSVEATRVTRVLCHHWRVLVLVTHLFYCMQDEFTEEVRSYQRKDGPDPASTPSKQLTLARHSFSTSIQTPGLEALLASTGTRFQLPLLPRHQGSLDICLLPINFFQGLLTCCKCSGSLLAFKTALTKDCKAL